MKAEEDSALMYSEDCSSVCFYPFGAPRSTFGQPTETTIQVWSRLGMPAMESVTAFDGVGTYSRPRSLTRPHTDLTVPASFDQVAILYPHMVNDARLDIGHAVFDGQIHAGAKVPVTAICFVVDFDNVFAGCGNNMAGVEHHGRDGGVVGIGVKNGPGAEIPDLFP